MTKYSADDFRKAEFARHPDGGYGARVDLQSYGSCWAVRRGGDYDWVSDIDLTRSGWVPVQEQAGSYTRTDESVDPEGDAAWWRARAEETEVQRDEWKDRAEKAERACKTLGKIVEDQCRDIARITRSERMVDADGDADWGAIWERGHELADRLEKAEQARDAAQAEAAMCQTSLAGQIRRAEQAEDALHALRAEQPRPLTPDAITDEMIQRARRRGSEIVGALWDASVVEAMLTAALTEPPAPPEGAEELARLIADADVGEWDCGDLADALLATGRVRLTTAEES